MLEHRDEEVRRAGLRIVQGARCGLPKQLSQRLAAHLRDGARVRGVAALALCRAVRESGGDFRSELLEALRGAQGGEMRDVLAALASLGADAAWAAEEVAQIFWSQDWSLRRAAAEAYGQIAGREATEAAQLAKLLKERR